MNSCNCHCAVRVTHNILERCILLRTSVVTVNPCVFGLANCALRAGRDLIEANHTQGLAFSVFVVQQWEDLDARPWVQSDCIVLRSGGLIDCTNTDLDESNLRSNSPVL